MTKHRKKSTTRKTTHHRDLKSSLNQTCKAINATSSSRLLADLDYAQNRQELNRLRKSPPLPAITYYPVDTLPDEVDAIEPLEYKGEDWYTLDLMNQWELFRTLIERLFPAIYPNEVNLPALIADVRNSNEPFELLEDFADSLHLPIDYKETFLTSKTLLQIRCACEESFAKHSKHLTFHSRKKQILHALKERLLEESIYDAKRNFHYADSDSDFSDTQIYTSQILDNLNEIASTTTNPAVEQLLNRIQQDREDAIAIGQGRYDSELQPTSWSDDSENDEDNGSSYSPG